MLVMLRVLRVLSAAAPGHVSGMEGAAPPPPPHCTHNCSNNKFQCSNNKLQAYSKFQACTCLRSLLLLLMTAMTCTPASYPARTHAHTHANTRTHTRTHTQQHPGTARHTARRSRHARMSSARQGKRREHCYKHVRAKTA